MSFKLYIQNPILAASVSYREGFYMMVHQYRQ